MKQMLWRSELEADHWGICTALQKSLDHLQAQRALAFNREKWDTSSGPEESGNLGFKICESINPEVPPPNIRASLLPKQGPDLGTATFLGLSIQPSLERCYLHD